MHLKKSFDLSDLTKLFFIRVLGQRLYVQIYMYIINSKIQNQVFIQNNTEHHISDIVFTNIQNKLSVVQSIEPLFQTAFNI